MAKTRDDTYPVKAEWKDKVRAELARRGRGSYTRLAAEIGCSTGQLTELLQADSKFSALVPKIHRAFGWDEPTPPLPGSSDVGEIQHLLQRLSKKDRELVLQAVDTLRGESGEDARQALISILKMTNPTK